MARERARDSRDAAAARERPSPVAGSRTSRPLVPSSSATSRSRPTARDSSGAGGPRAALRRSIRVRRSPVPSAPCSIRSSRCARAFGWRPGRSARVAFTTLVAETRERAIELADLYRQPYSAQRALDLSWTRTQVELRDLGITPSDAALFQQIAGHLFYSNPPIRAPQQELRENRLGQRGAVDRRTLRRLADPARDDRFDGRAARRRASCCTRISTGGSRE